MNHMYATTHCDEAERDARDDMDAEALAAMQRGECIICGAQTQDGLPLCDDCYFDTLLDETA